MSKYALNVLGSSISKDALSSCESIDVKVCVIGIDPSAIAQGDLEATSSDKGERFSSTRHICPADSSMTPPLTWTLSLSISRRVGEGRSSGDRQVREGRDAKKNTEKAEELISKAAQKDPTSKKGLESLDRKE